MSQTEIVNLCEERMGLGSVNKIVAFYIERQSRTASEPQQQKNQNQNQQQQQKRNAWQRAHAATKKYSIATAIEFVGFKTIRH